MQEQSDAGLVVIFNSKSMFQLATTALLMLSAFYGSAPIEVITDESAQVEVPTRETAPVNQPMTLEEYIRLYYYDTPILAEIARCESRFRHTGTDGRVIRGETSWEDVGVMQINEFYHEERAARLGLNLRTLDGNLAYAKWLYGKEGGTPWFASSKCWRGKDTLALANAIQQKN